MKSLDVSAENFENQRKVVKEEYRMRVSNAAYAPAQIRLEELVSRATGPTSTTPSARCADLDAAQLDWVRAFHDAYYAPNNAVLSIAGDFDRTRRSRSCTATSTRGTKQANVAALRAAAGARADRPRTRGRRGRARASTPGVFYGWAIPPNRDADHYALELAGDSSATARARASISGSSATRRLAQEVSGWTEDHRGPDLFAIEVKLAEGTKTRGRRKARRGASRGLAKARPDRRRASTRRAGRFKRASSLRSNRTRPRPQARRLRALHRRRDALNGELGEVPRGHQGRREARRRLSTSGPPAARLSRPTRRRAAD